MKGVTWHIGHGPEKVDGFVLESGARALSCVGIGLGDCGKESVVDASRMVCDSGALDTLLVC